MSWAEFVPFPCQNGDMGVEVAFKPAPPFFILRLGWGSGSISKHRNGEWYLSQKHNVLAYLLGKIPYIKYITAPNYCILEGVVTCNWWTGGKVYIFIFRVFFKDRWTSTDPRARTYPPTHRHIHTYTHTNTHPYTHKHHRISTVCFDRLIHISRFTIYDSRFTIHDSWFTGVATL